MTEQLFLSPPGLLFTRVQTVLTHAAIKSSFLSTQIWVSNRSCHYRCCHYATGPVFTELEFQFQRTHPFPDAVHSHSCWVSVLSALGFLFPNLIRMFVSKSLRFCLHRVIHYILAFSFTEALACKYHNLLWWAEQDDWKLNPSGKLQSGCLRELDLFLKWPDFWI